MEKKVELRKKSLTQRIYRDKDYLKTKEGLLFCVVGYSHPSDRVIAYLKYVPGEGLWRDEKFTYERILKQYTMEDIESTIKFLEERYPFYVDYLECIGGRMSAVPINRIAYHYVPSEKIRKIKVSKEKKVLEKKLIELIELLVSHSSIPFENFGVTGSILLGIQGEHSDIDLVIYGARNSFKIRKTMKKLFKEKKLLPLEGPELRKYCEENSKKYGVPYQQIEVFYSRKVDRGYFNGTFFSWHGVRSYSEIPEGLERVTPLGFIEAVCEVKRNKESFFLPAVYTVSLTSVNSKEVRVNESSLKRSLKEIVSYQGLYSGLFNVGDKVYVKGKLEEVKKGHSIYHRIVIGSREAAGKDLLLFFD